MKTSIATITIATIVGLIATACVLSSDTPPAPSRSPQVQPTPTVYRVEFGLGESVELPERGIGISFDQVVEDSRCPANVMCIVAGRAVIEVTVTEADTSAVVHPSIEPGTIVENPWVRAARSQPGSEDISIRMISLNLLRGPDDGEEGLTPTAVLEVMADEE